MMACISSTLALALVKEPNLFLATFLARFSPEFLIKSINLLSYGARPANSLTRARTNLVLLLATPFLYEILDAGAIADTCLPLFKPTAIPDLVAIVVVFPRQGLANSSLKQYNLTTQTFKSDIKPMLKTVYTRFANFHLIGHIETFPNPIYVFLRVCSPAPTGPARSVAEEP